MSLYDVKTIFVLRFIFEKGFYYTSRHSKESSKKRHPRYSVTRYRFITPSAT